MKNSRFIRATDRVTVVLEDNGRHVARNAIWWLLLEPVHDGPVMHFKPSKYTSFNTRWDKLNVPRSAGYKAYREHRCVIPATGFGETQKIAGSMVYHDLIADPDIPLAMGGLYREWHGHDSHGNVFVETSCSVVTLPPHPKLKDIHQKASPLMLSTSDNSLQRWLDSSNTQVELLNDLLAPKLRHNFTVVPINKPSLHQPIANSFSIQAD